MNTSHPTNEGTPVIYIVDDDEAVRFALSLLVGTCGWEFRAFGSVDEFTADQDSDPHAGCLVLDLNMPGKTGADLLEQLNPPMPAIVITGFSDSNLAERARRAGARAVLKKPFSDEVLLGHIREALKAA